MAVTAAQKIFFYQATTRYFFTFPLAFYFFYAIIILTSVECKAELAVNDYIIIASAMALSTEFSKNINIYERKLRYEIL